MEGERMGRRKRRGDRIEREGVNNDEKYEKIPTSP